MKESDLVKLSFAVSIIGMVLLVGIDYFYQIEPSKIKDITLNEVGKEIIIQAKITKAVVKNENLFLEVKDDSGSIEAVVFKVKEKVRKGDVVEIEGKVTKYKGNLEVVVAKLKTLRNDV